MLTGSPRAHIHDGPEQRGSLDEAEDTSAVRQRLSVAPARVSRRCARLKARRPPAAVRCAQP